MFALTTSVISKVASALSLGLQGQPAHPLETLILSWESRRLETPSDEKHNKSFILRVAELHQR
jgi:hypothetical protein